MIRKVLAAVDGSDHANKALDLAIELAKVHKADLVVVSCCSAASLTS